MDVVLPDAYRGEIAANHRAFTRLLFWARTFARLGASPTAVVFGQMAADMAWHHHGGVFASNELESLLVALGRRCAGPSEAEPSRAHPAAEGPRHLLHVLSEAYSVGGHTRLVWRWIQNDAGRTHSLALTRQDESAVPAALIGAVERSGGTMTLLSRGRYDPIDAARNLRALAHRADLIVLHTHPDDVVPTMALADRGGLPPVVLLNHADHVFWLGVSVSDVFVHLRESGLVLSAGRRGIPRERCPMLPLPLDPVRRSHPREEAKRQLELPEDCVLLLSVATEYKYTPVGALDFPRIAEEALAPLETARLLVVGPRPAGRWAEIEQRTAGRIRALGIRADLGLLWEAADVYLDSFPFTSRTSWLEASSHGTPVLGLAWRGVGADVMFADDPSFPAELLAAQTVDEYRRRLGRLVLDAPHRRELGERMAAGIRRAHCGAAWTGALESLYASISGMRGHAPPVPVPAAPRLDPFDLLLQGTHREIEFASHGYGGVLHRHAQRLRRPIRRWVKRWGLWRRGRGGG